MISLLPLGDQAFLARLRAPFDRLVDDPFPFDRGFEASSLELHRAASPEPGEYARNPLLNPYRPAALPA